MRLLLFSVWRVFPVSGIDGACGFAPALRPLPFLSNPSRKSRSVGLFDPRTAVQSFYTGAAVCFRWRCLARVLFKRDLEDCVAIVFQPLFQLRSLLWPAITGTRLMAPDALMGTSADHRNPFAVLLTVWAITVDGVVGNPAASSGTALARKVPGAKFQQSAGLGIIAGFAVNLSTAAIPGVMMNVGCRWIVQGRPCPAAAFCTLGRC